MSHEPLQFLFTNTSKFIIERYLWNKEQVMNDLKWVTEGSITPTKRNLRATQPDLFSEMGKSWAPGELSEINKLLVTGIILLYKTRTLVDHFNKDRQKYFMIYW